MTRVGRALATLIVVLAVSAACASIVIGRYGRVEIQGVATNLINPCGRESHPRPAKYFGVIADSNAGTKSYTSFVKKANVHPTIVDYFVSWGANWDPVPACYAIHQGAIPLLQVNLKGVDIAGIVHNNARKYLGYLTQFAQQVKLFNSEVVISLGHEMNGTWYTWGWKGLRSEGDLNTSGPHHQLSGVDPKIFVRFWQIVHQVFARQGVTNVKWLWTVNRAVKPATTPDPWWPGKQYVDWIGIDGHLLKSGDNFTAIFQHTVDLIRKVTKDPILIAETGISRNPSRPNQIAELYRYAFTHPGLLGVIYFDVKVTRVGKTWPLTDQQSIAAFCQAALPYEAAAQALVKAKLRPKPATCPRP